MLINIDWGDVHKGVSGERIVPLIVVFWVRFFDKKKRNK